MTRVYVGLDLGSSSFQQVVMQPDGATINSRRFSMSEANLITAFGEHERSSPIEWIGLHHPTSPIEP